MSLALSSEAPKSALLCMKSGNTAISMTKIRRMVFSFFIIVVATTGLALCHPDYRLSTAIRLMRFLLTALGAILGLVGVSVGLLVLLLILGNFLRGTLSGARGPENLARVGCCHPWTGISPGTAARYAADKRCKAAAPY